VARFEAERQALALMDHPNIAKVFDAGTTETGQPFIAMELVKGIPITQYCDEHQLAPRDRLELFIPVCKAIGHAHQKGIIHRDLKPSNVMVAKYDGQPVPKVIDFGVAKATGPKLTERTLFTEFGAILGTLEYMSPEQAELNQLDVDTRSDIYSLGVLLYELLTGTTPLGRERKKDSSIMELLRLVREDEPPPPSTRLSTAEDLPSIAARRGVEPKKLTGLIRGDLDSVVMMAIEKDRNRRYETANSLANDIARYLNNEPVEARPPSAAYRFQKAWRRNRLAYTAGLAVSAALILGLGVSLWQTGEANRSRHLAEDASKRAEAGEANARRRLYTANMNLAFKAVKENRLGRAAELLNLSRPAPGEADPRGWEWRYLWQAIQGDELLSLPESHDYGVHTLAYSPDIARRILASASWTDKTVRLWNTRNYQELTNLPHQASVESLAFNSTGEWLAVLTAKRSFDDGESQVSLWRMEEPPQLFHRFAVKADSDTWWRRAAVTFTPDDSLLVVGQVNGEILLYDYKNKAEVTSFQAHPSGSAINALAFSQDKKWLASAGNDQVVKLWKWTGTPAHPRFKRDFLVHNGREDAAIFSLQFDPTARWLVAGGVFLEGSNLKVWDVQTGEPVRDLVLGVAFIAKGLAFSPGGRYLITTGGDQWLRFWDTTSWTETARLRGHKRPIWSLAISPSGERLATGGEDRLIKIWDADHRGRTGDATKTLSGLSRVVFSRDSASFLTVETVVDTHHWRVFRSDDMAEIKELKIRELDAIREDVLKELNIDLAGDTLVIADSSGEISVWDVPSSERIRTLPSVLPAVNPISGRRDFRGALVLSPNGDRLAFQSDQSESRVIRVLNISSGEVLARLRFDRPQWPVAFSPDGQQLMACEPGGLVLWDLRTSKPSHGPDQAWAWVAFSRDGRKVATADLDGFVTLLQVTESGLELQRQMNPDRYGLFGPCFSPNGDRLAVVCGSGIVWLCDPRTGQEQEVATLEYATARGAQAWFSPNGNNLFVYSNHTLQVYEAPPFSEIEKADPR
jgi:WD40 repeat protein